MIRSITRRDVAVALAASAMTVAVAAAAQQAAPAIQRSAVFDLAAVPPRTTDVGSVRQVLRTPTTTLKELEIHVTTLKPGIASHAPHHHPNEELVILDEGTVEVLVHGEWKRMERGSFVLNASNEEHALRNVGSGPATYHVVNWTTSDTPAK